MDKILFRNGKQLVLPLIQGGMGIGVSLGGLAGAVMKQDAMGCISMAMPGYNEHDFKTNTLEANHRAIIKEVKKAREISGQKGLLAVNVMTAGNHADDYTKMAVEAGVDAIISGAGLPLKLPEYVNEDTLIAPIVSSGKAARLILKSWDMRYGKTADFIVIEGWRAGGHLGFKKTDLEEHLCQENEEILADVLSEIKPFEEKFKRTIPVFVAGGVRSGKDIAHFISLGAAGVQMATRFIATHECDAHPNFKEMIVQASQDTIVLAASPAGFPGRAVENDFLKKVKTQRVASTHCINCLAPCNPALTPYCITEALIRAVKGDRENGLFFTGTQASEINKIVSVQELIQEIKEEWESEETR